MPFNIVPATNWPVMPWVPCPAQPGFNPNRCAAPPAIVAPPIALAVGARCGREADACDLAAAPCAPGVRGPTVGLLHPNSPWGRAFVFWFLAIVTVALLDSSKRRRDPTDELAGRSLSEIQRAAQRKRQSVLAPIAWYGILPLVAGKLGYLTATRTP